LPILRPLAFVLAALLAWPEGASAGPLHLTDSQKLKAMDFAMHDAVFTLFHESAHLLIGELDLPVLGKEEDAADSFAVVEMLRTIGDKPERIATLKDIANDWYYSSLSETADDLATYDEHSSDIERANAMVCLMVGADPDDFKATADEFGLDADDEENCVDTYGQAAASWDAELAPHRATGATAPITVKYEDAGPFQNFADELKKRQILEHAAAAIGTAYAMPNPLSIIAGQCTGDDLDSGATYDADSHTITYCYQLTRDEYQLDADNAFSRRPGKSK